MRYDNNNFLFLYFNLVVMSDELVPIYIDLIDNPKTLDGKKLIKEILNKKFTQNIDTYVNRYEQLSPLMVKVGPYLIQLI